MPPRPAIIDSACSLILDLACPPTLGAWLISAETAEELHAEGGLLTVLQD